VTNLNIVLVNHFGLRDSILFPSPFKKKWPQPTRIYYSTCSCIYVHVYACI